jgi:gluconate 2-dehydrogenase gamma chain
MEDEPIERRRFLKVAGASGAVIAGALVGVLPVEGCAPLAPVASPSPPAPSPSAAAPSAAAPASAAPSAAATPPPDPPLVLNATEYAFVEAAVDTLIPADHLGPSGSACGIAVFVDRQLAGAYGSGARLYRDGPFLKGKPEHGYQLALTPREFIQAGIAATNEWTRASHGKPFDLLSEADRAATLTALETGTAELPEVGGKAFFEALLALTVEGFFADPIYGGNRDKAGWKLVGYPGLPATYAVEIVRSHDKPFAPAPRSIADFS